MADLGIDTDPTVAMWSAYAKKLEEEVANVYNHIKLAHKLKMREFPIRKGDSFVINEKTGGAQTETKFPINEHTGREMTAEEQLAHFNAVKEEFEKILSRIRTLKPEPKIEESTNPADQSGHDPI